MINLKEWHHGYIGIVGLFFGILYLQYWLIFLSIVLIIDEIIQILTDNQYGGILHIIYIKTIYKISLIKKINLWLDKLFGKENV